MNRPTIRDLIDRAGGPKAIATASRKSRSRVSFYAPQKWALRGAIPPEHWDLIMELAGVSLEVVYEAHRDRVRPKQPRAALVAA